MILNKNLAIIGCGGHSKVVTEIAESIGFKKFSILINLSKKIFFK